ncbi:MAG: hypothetical protein OEZ14_08605, partial [Acidimicrobiia bacterium]|nr:hypothetical protein [Acidimicrobiia bacterium]
LRHTTSEHGRIDHRVAVGRKSVADIDRYDQQMKASRKRLRAAVATSLDTAVRMRSTPGVDEQLARQSLAIANRHRADLATALLIAKQTT